nr:EOG090X013U [Ilyocryptus agilis]
MDQEDLGSFGIAPQVLRAKDEFGENQVSKKRLRPVYAPSGPIPGMPALHSLLHPVKETIGVKLLQQMGWKPNQGVGERLTKKEKKERKKREKHLRAYTCGLPPGYGKKQSSDGETSDEDDEESEQLFAPDDVPTYVVQPKTNTFGLGYSGLMPMGTNTSSRGSAGFVLFEPTLSLTDRNKKLKIAGQAFGVGAFEREDADIYAKDDMSQYDFELGGPKQKKPNSQLLALPSSDLLDGFVRSTNKAESKQKSYPLPVIPRDFVPIHRSQKSRFDVKPMTETEFRGLGRHDLNAHHRAAIMEEVLEIPPGSTEAESGALSSTPAPPPGKMTASEIVAQALAQIRKTVAARREKAEQKPVHVAPPLSVIDPQREAKIASVKSFVQSSLSAVSSTFQPFARDPVKQFRFDAYSVLKKAGRLEEFHLLQPEGMTEWEVEREKEEFERSITLYRPMTTTMQNRFTSGGHVEENIQGGLVAQVESLKSIEVPARVKSEPVEKDPAKRAARRKQFGPLTRTSIQWIPDRLLCIRFNVPNPFSDAGGPQNSSKLSAKGSGAKFSIFDVLSTGPTQAAGPSFVSTGFESSVSAVKVEGPAVNPQQLEWEKAARGELMAQEKVEPEVLPSSTEQEESAGVEEEAPYERPSMDLFKAIFEESDSEEEEEREEVKPKEVDRQDVVMEQQPETETVKEDLDEDEYGPRLPSSAGAVKTAIATFGLNQADNGGQDVDDWVERDQKAAEKLKKSKPKSKKEKKNKKSKKHKKDKKGSKKRKRRHSDVSSSSASTDEDDDDDVKILKKIVALKKQQKL